MYTTAGKGKEKETPTVAKIRTEGVEVKKSSFYNGLLCRYFLNERG